MYTQLYTINDPKLQETVGLGLHMASLFSLQHPPFLLQNFRQS